MTAGRRIRVIPTLLLDRHGRLVKTVRFGKRTYIGDPVNAVRIFNQKEVDELILLDIDASRADRAPNFALIEDIASEAFMPVSYGGGIADMEHVVGVFGCGVEKVILSSALNGDMALVGSAAARFGSQAVTACLPIGRRIFGDDAVRVRSGRKTLTGLPEEIARRAVEAGAGEVIVYDIARDGTFSGYDTALLQRICAAVDVPVVACGGASRLADFVAAVNEGGASAVAAGSFFLYQSERRGVLISYPSQKDLETRVFGRLA
jgi:cyclase